MSRKYLNIEVILIYFLLLIPWPHTHIIKYLCSKDNSRLVRKIVRSKWTPILDKYSAKLPLECPLHPLRDVFAPCQDAKKRDRPTQWTCRLCGKSFYQERFLDLHFHMRHKSVINEAEDAICLADFCDIMRCEVFQSEEASSLTTSDQRTITEIEVWGDSLRQNSALAKANTPYLSLIPLRTSSIGGARGSKAQNRQLCQEKMGQSNFRDTVENVMKPTNNNNNEANEPNMFMKNGHADHEHSTGTPTTTSNTEPNKAANTQTTTPTTTHNSHYTKTQKKQKKKRKNFASGEDGRNEPNEAEDDEGNSHASSNASKLRTEDGNGDGVDADVNNIQKQRANCKADELRKLKVQCELLVRSCIASLILTMNEQSFKEMEDEMNLAVCWYLTCDRYWEDGPLEPRTFPWGLALILIFVLSTGVCFCYYIIWILFNTEEATINTEQQHDYMYQRYQHTATAVGHGMHQTHQQQQQQQFQHQHQQHQQQHQAYAATTATASGGGMRPNMSQPYYYQQQQQPGHHELYPEQLQYDYRHSPRRYMIAAESHAQQQQNMPTGAMDNKSAGTPRHRHQQLQQQHGSATQTPIQQQSHVYTQDILDRRDYTSSSGGVGGRPIATTAVTGLGGNKALALTKQSSGGSSSGGALMGSSSVSVTMLDDEAAAAAAAQGGVRHYNTHPRPLNSHHRSSGGSQHSLRASSSIHEFAPPPPPSDIGQNEHYIYVTYPPDLKKRYFDKYE